MSTPSKAGEIFNILRSEVLRGQYREGERLPSERDLAARFETNRGAIREAIKKLEQLGVVSVTPGGVRVQPVGEASVEVLGHLLELGEIPRPELITQMLDVLGAMMAVSVRTAVENATDEEIEALTQLTDNLIKSLGKPEIHHERWRELGEKMMTIHQNLVLRLVGNGVRTQFLGVTMEPKIEPNIDLSEIAEQLTAVRNAIHEKDAWAASTGMTNHFKILKERIQTATSAMESKDLQPARSAING
ncbi:MAG: FadR family transcriptional regulator [Pseudomonadales bacterium]|nr:FadR family transcriptional regulator [Pseudomonadales bacterium]MBO6566687.1 FadR family transcriptional regulator [Pseudomonadales bacterium]MBO6595649.1 FadR family transcriptional regulator [Pseudomonadales bacterium]MBO6655718.1 FadR family transcriptional regulator [Pseudomonadales bacterium]MBO6820793.1 FadR family transcriptional regulator [Pseudomonadales bacterium]